MEFIRGVIQKIIYANESNGYCVCSIKIDYTTKDMEKYKNILFSNLLTVASYYDFLPVKGEEIEYNGEFIETKYGIQLKAKSFKRQSLNTKEGIVNYLSSDYFYKVGVVSANLIYDTLGPDCLNLIKNDKSVLDKLNLSEEIKNTVYTVLVENSEIQNNLLPFLEMGFTMEMSKRIIKSLKDYELPKAFKNPYYLINRVQGIGFLRADKIGLEIGIKKDSKIRLVACIYYILQNNVYESGNTYIEKELLKSLVFETLNQETNLINDELFTDILNSLISESKIIIDEYDYVYEYSLYKEELNIANTIKILIDKPSINKFSDQDINNALSKSKVKNKIEYTQKQEKAIFKSLKNNITIITGGPGTGKTTIIKGLIDALTYLYKKDFIKDFVTLLAPTGKASKRMSEVTKIDAQTIHKYLGYNGQIFTLIDNKDTKFLIVDEVSMVDTFLFSNLLRSLQEDTQVVLVGDVDQIPSIGPGEILFDLIDSKIIDTIKLDLIHRQDTTSSIITLAHSINEGYIPENILEKQIDRTFIETLDFDMLEILAQVVTKATKTMDILKDIQILVPMYRSDVGIDKINEYIQNLVNPATEEVTYFNQKFRINDKVIQLVNRSDVNLMNGEIGFIHSFEYTASKISKIIVQYDQLQVGYLKEEFDQLKLAYAISIHKSQGSEFQTVIIPISKKFYPMLKRKLYYTAITRAKKYLIILGSIEALKIASLKVGEKRKTRLKDYLNYTNTVSPYDFM